MRRTLYMIGMAFGVAAAAHAQTALTAACPANPTAPCINLSWTNASMTAAVTKNVSGQQTAGPGTAEVFTCIGNGTQCAANMLPAVGSETLPQGSGWQLVGTIAQATTAGSAGIPNAQWGTLYQLQVRNIWSAGGGPGAFAATFPSITINAAPATQPVAPTPGVPVVVYPSGF